MSETIILKIEVSNEGFDKLTKTGQSLADVVYNLLENKLFKSRKEHGFLKVSAIEIRHSFKIEEYLTLERENWPK